MYLKKPNPSQLQAMGSSIKRKDETSKGSVQSAPRVSGKATLSLVIRRTRFTKAKIHLGNYNLEIFLIRPQTRRRNITHGSVFLNTEASGHLASNEIATRKYISSNTYRSLKKEFFRFKFTELSINQIS